MPNVTPARAASFRYWRSVASGSVPTAAVSWSVVVTWQRVHGLTSFSVTSAVGNGVEVILVVCLETGEYEVRTEAIHRKRGDALRGEPGVQVGE